MNHEAECVSLTTSVAIVIAGRSNVSVHDLSVVDFREVGVNFSGIEAWLGNSEPTIYATGNSFYNNTVTNCSTYVDHLFGSGNVQFGGQKGFLLHDNVITQPSRGNGGQGIGWPVKMANEGYIKGCKVYNNTLIKEPFTGAYGGDDGWNFAMEFWNIQGFEVYNNRIQGNIDHANTTKGEYAYGAHIHDNIFSAAAISQHYEEGIFLETDTSDVLIEKNIFRNLASGIGFAPHDYRNDGVGINVHRVTIRDNLFESVGFLGGSQGIGIRWHGTDSNPVTYVSEISIDHNTFTAASGSNAALVAIALPGYQSAVANQIKVRNNIIRGFWYAAIHGAGPYLGSVNIQNNVLFQNGNNDDPLFSGGVNPSTYVYQSTLKQDPLFVSGTDFHLQSSSPAINAGLNLGLPFLGMAPDIGAYEKQ